jgi:hypothetical protein
MTIERRMNLLDLIAKERARQESLPGSEYDQKHSRNDWIAIATMYLSRAANRKQIPVTNEEYQDSLIKAAAVILAALEHDSRQ